MFDCLLALESEMESETFLPQCSFISSSSSLSPFGSVIDHVVHLVAQKPDAVIGRGDGRDNVAPEETNDRKHVQKTFYDANNALWSRTTRDSDVSTRPFARPFACTAHSLAGSALTRSSVCLHRSLICLLRTAHFAHSFTRSFIHSLTHLLPSLGKND